MLMLMINAMTSQASPPFCEPSRGSTINPGGELGCGGSTRSLFYSGFSDTSYLQFHKDQYDFIDQWFHISLNNLSLVDNEQIHLIEYYGSVNRDRGDLLGSLVLQNAPIDQGDIDTPLFEIFWQLPDSPDSDSYNRHPLLQEVTSGQVPFLSEVTSLCFHLVWHKSSLEKPGFINISIQPFSANNIDDIFTMSNRNIRNQYRPISMVRTGMVLVPPSPMLTDGFIDLRASRYENCGYQPY